MRIGFFGTPELATQVLRDLIDTPDMEIVFVVTNPDKPFGREQLLRSSMVKEIALKHNIPSYTPEKIRGNNGFLDIMRSFACDYFVVVAYGKILPLDLLEIPEKMCINIHGSLLPAYRGASPIQAALLHGESVTGVTIMRMSEGMDEGDILKVRAISIEDAETTGTLFAKFAAISGPTLIQTLRELETGGITPLPQDHERATYCKKIEKGDGLINWSRPAREIYHMWQAYTPWPGIYTIYQGKRLLLETVGALTHTTQKSVGTGVKMEDGTIGIVCGEGILTLTQVKLEGKKSQDIRDFVNGNQKFIGYNF